MNVRKAKHGTLLTVLFTIISIAYVYPIFLVLINSFKKKAYISRDPFSIPQGKIFVGLDNYVKGIQKTGFVQAFGLSLFITICSVAVIILCTSMCAWYICRVKNAATNTIYYLCLFSMIVPFQMVMFTLSKIANILHLNNPVGIIVVYLGFGAGLSVFMFSGFVKSIPLEIEEAAMIDGANRFQRIKSVTLPSIAPTISIMLIMQIGRLMSLGYEKIIKEEHRDDVVGTIGYVKVSPNAASIIPGSVELILELRCCSEEIRQRVKARVGVLTKEIEEKRGVTIERKLNLDQKEMPMDPEVIAAIDQGIAIMGQEPVTLVSMAGHDAANMARVTRSAMIFVQSINGKSHCPEEATDIDRIEETVNAMLQAVLILDDK